MSDLRKQYNIIQKIRVWFGGNSVVVYTMGKVGTLTICNSLNAISYRHVHPHSLRYTKPGVYFLKLSLPVYKKIYFSVKTVLKRLKVVIWKSLKNEIIIISGVRDPYSRNVSAFFEQAHYFGGLDVGMNLREVREEFDRLCDFFAPINWFDEEIYKVTGINVYDYSFNKDKGFVSIKKGKYKIFIYRLDKLNELGKELKKFIDSPSFEIVSTNFTADSLYSSISKKFASYYKYASNISNVYAESKYMKHFYTETEVENLKTRWV